MPDGDRWACLLSQTLRPAVLFPPPIDVSCLTFSVPPPSGSLGCMGMEYPEVGLLLHLCGAEDWHEAQRTGEVRPESLTEVGFVHLSGPWQVHLPANRLFPGRTDLVALHIDPAALHVPVRWEPGVPGDPESMLFPHAYGALPVSAVVAVQAYRPDSAGRFPELSGIAAQDPVTPA